MNYRAKGIRRHHTPGEMNSTERAYSERLFVQRAAKEIQWYAFEAIKLKIAPSTFYTPDFVVMGADDVLELHEVKGHWEDDARVKVKAVASLFPFRVRCFTPRPKREGGGWKEEVLSVE